ncbi:hypothetical protein HNY73_016771 [Argiope bruennichi]|uniref:Uncharacterized protein n=1 Tax=Argiope bruennichi TaxID=94029 RepID=A0A8T0EJT1_ARGBR|nr:hypothetical protein HNY73_016771 [Argiope bruennichi]
MNRLFTSQQRKMQKFYKIKSTFTGQAEDRKIDAGSEMKNLQMKSNESANDYVARARGMATKCHSLGLDATPRELVYYTVRGLKGKFSKVLKILKIQLDKSVDEILEIIRDEENTCYSPTKDENSDSSILYHRGTLRQRDADMGDENETPDVESSSNNIVNQIPLRRSESLKSKQMAANVAHHIPNTYLEAKNNADWNNWETVMQNELDSLNKHEV